MFTTANVARISRMFIVWIVSASLCQLSLAQQAPRRAQTANGNLVTARASRAVAARKLQLRRIVLYKSGVGYFEHTGRVRGNEQVQIDLTGSQLDDVLKSLTARDLNGGRIVGASYNSQEPTDRQLEAMRIPVSSDTNLLVLLQNLRGAELEMRTAAGVFSGRILSVQERMRSQTGGQVATEQISLMSDTGVVRSFILEPTTQLRLKDGTLQQELLRALGLLDSSHKQDTHRLLLSTAGTGERDVTISYTSEVPVWKTTYRIMLPGGADASGAKAFLQGWAIVDNTVGEDWTDVELSLAAGAPQSFIQTLSQPYYTQRVTVPMPSGFRLSPQTHGGTMAVSDRMQSAGALRTVGQLMAPRDLPGPGGGLPGGLGGGDILGALGPRASGAVGRQAQGSTDETDALAPLSINAAQGSKLGELFEYKLRDKVTIRKNESALVPIIQTTISAERVALWNAGMGTARPLRALWIQNTSSLVLDGGSFNVIDGGAFGGEGLLDSIQPGEKRLISYAALLGMQTVAKHDGNVPPKVTRMRIERGIIMRTIDSRQRTIYTIRNENTSSQVLVLEHPIRNDWKISNDAKPLEQSATAYSISH